MAKKIRCLIIILLINLSTLPIQSTAINICLSTDINKKKDMEIFLDIQNTEGKVLIFDDKIGDVHVKYWHHVFNDILIVNDSILLHLDINSKDVVKYKKSWTNINDIIIDYNEWNFKPRDCLKAQMVFFPDENDCNNFYTFYDDQKYPIVCFEIWYDNGETLLYNQYGKIIGYGIPMPSSGFSLSGYDYNPQYPDDPWISYRKNADDYFQDWCTSADSISLPSKDTVSSYVQDPSVQLFYEIAHGDHTKFLLNKRWERYYFSTARNDMENRPPMRFAFIGSCKGMNNVGPNSFSYQFRKGGMEWTTTIGYINMTQSAWTYSYYWQDYMFNIMDKKAPIYDAFIEACAQYPGIANNVLFVGDKNMTVFSKPRMDANYKISDPVLFSIFKICPIYLKIFKNIDLIQNIFN